MQRLRGNAICWDFRGLDHLTPDSPYRVCLQGKEPGSSKRKYSCIGNTCCAPVGAIMYDMAASKFLPAGHTQGLNFGSNPALPALVRQQRWLCQQGWRELQEPARDSCQTLPGVHVAVKAQVI